MIRYKQKVRNKAKMNYLMKGDIKIVKVFSRILEKLLYLFKTFSIVFLNIKIYSLNYLKITLIIGFYY